MPDANRKMDTTHLDIINEKMSPDSFTIEKDPNINYNGDPGSQLTHVADLIDRNWKLQSISESLPGILVRRCIRKRNYRQGCELHVGTESGIALDTW